MIWLILLLIALSAFFSSAETALVSLGRIKVAGMVKRGLSGAKAVAKLKEHPRRLIITILIANNVVNIWAAALATIYATQAYGSYGVGIATGVITFLILVFGDIVPKGVAITKAEPYSRIVAPLILLLERVLYPLVIALEALVNLFAKHQQQLMTEDEFRSLIAVGAQDKVIEQKEADLIEDILRFNDIPVKQIMTPRSKVFTLQADMPLEQALPLLQKARFARVPLIKKSRDNVIGILLLKDAFSAVGKGKPLLQDIMLPPLFVSGERRAAGLFRDLQRKHVHMAVIVDEYGGMAGIITLEDLMAEIMGEIGVEGDLKSEPYQRIAKGTVLVQGDVEIRTLNEFFHSKIPQGTYVTLNGYLMHEFRRVPRSGSVLQRKDLRFTILESDERQVLKVRIEKA
ncbi:MAG: hemolysin family protein [Nanoarchaeota archaeon]